MLAASGFATVGLLLALILTRRASPLVALVGVPVLAALALGRAASLGEFVSAGIQQTAPVAATFIFAIIYFGVMSDAGMLDPVIDRVTRTIGSHPMRVVLGSAVLAALVHLDGSGAVTFLVVIPALLPFYEHLRIDRRVLACVVGLSAGVMNIVPWGGPTLRAATSLQVPVGTLFPPLVPVVAVGLLFVLGVAVFLGLRESTRLGLRGRAAELDADPARHVRVLTGEERALRRPGRRWFNVLLTIVVLVVMVMSWVPPALAFMFGAAVALAVNYPGLAEQRARVDAHAKAALMMATILLAAGAFTGIMKGSGMLTAMAAALVGVMPVTMASQIPVAVAVLSMPLSLVFDPDSFYFGVLPVIAQVAATAGVEPIQVGQAALLGQMTVGFPVSPLTPATFLLVGLSGIDLAEHQRFTIPWMFATTIVMTIAAMALGVIAP